MLGIVLALEWGAPLTALPPHPSHGQSIVPRRFWTEYRTLLNTEHPLPPTAHRPPTADRRPPTAAHRPPAADRRLSSGPEGFSR
ncbi:MAG: hypothetical protein ACKV19_03290 [Verrucomicrobiales bacterium]